MLSYLTYGLSFVVVAHDVNLVRALSDTLSHATDRGDYAKIAFGHLVTGAVASIILAGLVRNAGMVVILTGAFVVAVHAVFAAAYRLMVFRNLDGERIDADGSIVADATGS